MTDLSNLTGEELQNLVPSLNHLTKYGEVKVKAQHRKYVNGERPHEKGWASVESETLTVNGIEYRASASMVYNAYYGGPGEEGWATSYTYGGLYIRRIEGGGDTTLKARRVIEELFIEACELLDKTFPQARLEVQIVHAEVSRRIVIGNIEGLKKEILLLEQEAVELADQIKQMQITLEKRDSGLDD